MACHELAALRVGLMNVVGIVDEVERKHELAEIGDLSKASHPIQEMVKANSLAELQGLFEASLGALEAKTASLGHDHPQLGYYRTLVVTTKKVELELKNHVDMLGRFFRDLEEVHDLIHEVFPVAEA